MLVRRQRGALYTEFVGVRRIVHKFIRLAEVELKADRGSRGTETSKRRQKVEKRNIVEDKCGGGSVVRKK